MKQKFMRMLDRWIPQDIKEFERSEELDRARALVFLLSLHIGVAVISLIRQFVITGFSYATPSSMISLALGVCLSGYVLAVVVFRYTGLFMVSGNIFALTFYASIFVGVLALKLTGQELIACILYLLALPLLVTLIANYLSGILWVVMVAIAPLLLNTFGRTDIGQFFLGNWVALCLGLFTAIYLAHNYFKHLSQRLNTKVTWFEFAATHDPLTGVSNRMTFDRHLEESIEFCKLHGTKTVLIYIDLDKFKPINDTYGHQAGDIVLSTVADRLLHLVRRTDTVARLGGDEFALLFDQCSPESIKPLIDRLEAVVSAPIDVRKVRLSVSCSFGLVVCPDDGIEASQLAQKADERMYEAKRKRNANWGATATARRVFG